MEHFKAGKTSNLHLPLSKLHSSRVSAEQQHLPAWCKEPAPVQWQCFSNSSKGKRDILYSFHPSWTPLQPPSPSHPSGLSQSTSFECPASSNLHWSPILHKVIYMFQCYSLKSSHPCLLPYSPKVCSLHLCLFCCFVYKIIITVFLNSIYMC